MAKEYILTDHQVLPNIDALQTEAIQAVFDLCKKDGGTVIVPHGRYRTGGLRMWSNTTLILQSGAYLIGSDICEDYAVFEVPETVALRTDMELITQYYENRPWKEYRRAILSVYGGENIAILGAPDSHIDGDDCTDPHGEEGYRGPHGIFITNVEHLTLSGYTIENCGNFMHQIDNCRDIHVHNVTCLGGSDAIHLHCCERILIEHCMFHTGDDCIAGINMKHLTVRHCDLNTSCDVFRVGGEHILIENCHMWGPGIYPHRCTVVQNRYTEAVRNKENTLPQTCGRHNLICVWVHFASTNFPNPTPYHDIVFRNCTIENADRFLLYHADSGPLESGTHLTEVTLDHVTFTGLIGPSSVAANAEEPLTVTLDHVRTSFRADTEEARLFCEATPNIKIITRN